MFKKITFLYLSLIFTPFFKGIPGDAVPNPTETLQYFDYQDYQWGEKVSFKATTPETIGALSKKLTPDERKVLIIIEANGERRISYQRCLKQSWWDFFNGGTIESTVYYEGKIDSGIYTDSLNLDAKLPFAFSLKSLSLDQLPFSKKVLWLNALHIFDGKSYFSETKFGSAHHRMVNCKIIKNPNDFNVYDSRSLKPVPFRAGSYLRIEIHKFGSLIETNFNHFDVSIFTKNMRDCLNKMISFDSKGNHCFSSIVNALPQELIKHLKEAFPTQKSIRKLTKEEAIDLYHWICDKAAEEFNR